MVFVHNDSIFGTGILMLCFLVKTENVNIASMIMNYKSIRVN